MFIPLSIASGKKPTGFVYQIEGTGDGDIATTNISVKGDHITQVTLGTLEYIKIPQGAIAEVRIRIEIRGFVHESYNISIYRIHYKSAPSDARYKKFEGEIRTKTLTFS